MSTQHPWRTIQRARGWLSTLALCAFLVPIMAACEGGNDDDPLTAPPATSTEFAGQADATETPSSEPKEPMSSDEPTVTDMSINTPEATATTPATDTPALTNPSESTATPEPPPTNTPAPTSTPIPESDRTEVEVLEVIDGDTLRVSWQGSAVSVRIIGVDTPETVHPTEPVACFGPEASAFTRQMVEQAGWKVLLEKDVSETDQYNRLLRYVWLPHADGVRFLNEELVAQGYAQVSTYPPDVKYTDLFLQRQREARENGRGLWGECGAFGVPLATPTPEPAPPAPPSGNCAPSYPDVCIPPSPPDLDCGDISAGRFTVLPPDPHRFDGDGDGLGCESN